MSVQVVRFQCPICRSLLEAAIHSGLVVTLVAPPGVSPPSVGLPPPLHAAQPPPPPPAPPAQARPLPRQAPMPKAASRMFPRPPVTPPPALLAARVRPVAAEATPAAAEATAATEAEEVPPPPAAAAEAPPGIALTREAAGKGAVPPIPKALPLQARREVDKGAVRDSGRSRTRGREVQEGVNQVSHTRC